MRATNPYLILFRARQQCFEDLLSLANAQLAFIEQDDYTGLLGLLGQKQRSIGRLEELARTHPNLISEWRQQRDSFPANERQACESALETSESLLETLMQLDARCTDIIAARRAQTQQALRSVNAAAETQTAYRDTLAPVTHRHLDIGQ